MSKISEWRTKIGLWIGLPLFAAAAIAYGATDLVPAWKAHNGGGTTGTFTAEREECGRRSCSFYGAWEAAGGDRRRSDVKLFDEPDSLVVGQAVEAVDTGASGVFAAAGGSTYLFVTGFMAAGFAALAGWVFVIRNALRRRRQRKAAAPVAA
ncbi:hypothetical protein [Couchioplanes azureus]|uniref:hypothetical protein n=1 Tax=Couchioplanes caeruleus TaxID=56438 RepID=UPI00166F7D27|nr:hypothetical protein [Couchioplanes caeruleus]GGQ51042.1 hypothetical protein GCM10010166_19680 [Couchioplanes caeruleus subsp. azureus]